MPRALHLRAQLHVVVSWPGQFDPTRRCGGTAAKAHPVDVGLIPVFDPGARNQPGRALETAVRIELERRRYAVTYVRTRSGFEVDFLARSLDGAIELIQVCADATDPATAERELRAVADVGDAYPTATKRLLTLTRDRLPQETPGDVIVQPAYEWMLAAPGSA